MCMFGVWLLFTALLFLRMWCLSVVQSFSPTRIRFSKNPAISLLQPGVQVTDGGRSLVCRSEARDTGSYELPSRKRLFRSYPLRYCCVRKATCQVTELAVTQRRDPRVKVVCDLIAAHIHNLDDALDPQFAESFFQGPAVSSVFLFMITCFLHKSSY